MILEYLSQYIFDIQCIDNLKPVVFYQRKYKCFRTETVTVWLLIHVLL